MALGTWQQEQILSPREALGIRNKIRDMQEGWRTVSVQRGLYTLGYASYIDCPTDAGRQAYYDGSGTMNAALHHEMGWLYRRLLSRLEAMLGGPVRYRATCALPGFHIFLGGEGVDLYQPSVHVDGQYLNLLWGAEEQTDFSRTVSFTLSIELPRVGAGLNMWEDHPLDEPPADQASFLDTYSRLPSRLHEYTEGVMVLHTGKLVHQIAMGDRSEGNNRITLQGHAIWTDGAWQAYW